MNCVPIAPHERELTAAIADKVVVAMSGGVDSSVAALLLQRRGVPCVGVSMQVWDYRNHGGSESRATCCAPSDFNDARRVSASVGMPYYVLDFEHFFREKVIDLFVQSYVNGLTPNPCVECNRKVKFRELRTRALVSAARRLRLVITRVSLKTNPDFICDADAIPKRIRAISSTA